MRRVDAAAGEADDAPAAGPPRRLELAVPSDPAGVRPAVDRVVRAFAGLGPAAGAWELRLRVTVGEAVANAARHGNRGAPRRRVRVTAEAVDDVVRVTVEDEGRGFDPSAPPDPTLPGHRERTGGRGLFLQRELTDRMRHEDGGRRVVLLLRPDR